MKKILLFLSLVFVLSNSCTQLRSLEKRTHSVNRSLESIVAFPDFKTAGFAFYAVDINTGETIAQKNPDMALKPASTLKLLSTATVLELLGPEHQFETTLEYSGVVDSRNQLLTGDIFIHGGGDPTLGSKYFDSTKEKQFLYDWVNAVSSLGVDSITGGVIADAHAFSWDIVPPAWSWMNMGNYYGAGPCGLSVFDNYYTVLFNTGAEVGDATKVVGVVPEVLQLQFDNTVTADSISYDNAYIYGAPYSSQRYVRGQLPVNKKNFKVKGSMPDPALVAALELNSLLIGENIITGQSATTLRLLQQEDGDKFGIRKVIYTTYSPELNEIIAQTNIHSINLFAEHCMISAGIELGAAPETVIAIDSVVNFWANRGMDTQGMALHDGSGLSQYNAITPRQLVFLLKYMKLESKYFDTYYNSMAIAGESGTLKNMFKGSIAEGKLRAKSGTVSRVKAYSGYVTSKSGREIAFSMMVNNFSCKSSEAKAKLEQLMIALAELNR